MTDIFDDKVDERKIIIITRIEPVGEPYREVCLSFVIRKKYFHEKS